mmetsp:Transcript_24966/g.30135  ORF Transcript_24966/g.30135 Transcript_24966/m.30135 type:complete len:125 (+) Transcript_24966:115-489(+)|eukprot:CAMPEP_0172487246 /NCGR_PEP_ID=MMETSP1066-20121228/16226_1 /TAXON_ID=671091 /ORGANISM="Coscinodiscus wailesii, Strain CCMP2513" /LENGTH=124 /DNA_ID=CAMNT_0013253719 /DNA_START=27 /DNA_END=401 /DNA_ORIENTATION=-
MAIDNLSALSASQKEELVASLSALILKNATEEITSETLITVAKASNNELSGSLAALFAKVVNMAGGIDKFCAAPGSGGGGGGGAGGDAAAAEEEEEEEKEEEEEMDLGGGMDMFGGDEAGGGDY